MDELQRLRDEADRAGLRFSVPDLESAIANAENNHGLDVDRLWVKEAFVGKSMVMKRWRARARGRGARIEKKFSNLTIIVREQDEK